MKNGSHEAKPLFLLKIHMGLPRIEHGTNKLYVRQPTYQ